VTRDEQVRVSIGVPSLNYGRFLSSCLESIRLQTHTNLEVLIADGGSTDDSLDVVARFVESDRRFRLISVADSGQADAVQKAFMASSGAIFTFLNADDCFMRQDATALAVSTFGTHPEAGLVSFGGWYIDETGTARRPVRRRYHPRAGRERIRYRTAMLQPSTFWRREVQELFPLRTDLSYVFDNWFFFQAFQTFPWIFRSERMAGYRLHGANKSEGVRPDRIRELARFEAFKFSDGAFRERYLYAVADIARLASRLPAGRRMAQKAIYLATNSLSFATCYRLPGI
jgi:glycosyltransferase involved in cell wall biosynthesis